MIIAKPKPIEEVITSLLRTRRDAGGRLDGCVTCAKRRHEGDPEFWPRPCACISKLRVSTRRSMKSASPASVISRTSRSCRTDRQLRCGVVPGLWAGVQFLAEMYRGKRIFPAVNTCFIGVTEQKGEWTERCQACGDCMLATTGGICPIARCSKRMSNGPCGGSANGKCEQGGQESLAAGISSMNG